LLKTGNKILQKGSIFMTEEKGAKPLQIDIEVREQGTAGFVEMDGLSGKVEKPGLLLHSCCGPCSSAVIERLGGDYQITIFFYNPCITDEAEYRRRRETQIEFLARYNESLPPKERVNFMEGPYDTRNFYSAAEGLEEEPEGGKRCRECFALRLEETAEAAKMNSFDYFGTTLTVSPHKSYEAISHIGRALALKYGLSFLDEDFKKKDGYVRSVQLSKQYGLYRQAYCGCRFSKR